MRKQIRTGRAPIMKSPFATTNQVEVLVPDTNSADSADRTKVHNSTLKFNWIIENFADRRVVIGTRDGLSHSVRPVTSRAVSTKPGVYIRRQITASRHSVKFDASNRLNDPLSEEQAVIKSQYNEGTGNTGHFSVDYYYFVSLESINDAGGCLYVREVDMIISIYDEDADLIHPFSEKGMEAYGIAECETLSDPELGTVSCRYVDNNQSRMSLYVNILGHVLRIPARRDVTRANGLYITYTNRVDRNEDMKRTEASVVVDFIPVEDFEKHGGLIFSSFEDAKHLGDLQKQREMELKQRDFELAKQKRELTELQMQLQRELDAQKHITTVETQRLNALAEEAKHANLMEKLKHEQRLAEMRAEMDIAKADFDARYRELELTIKTREAKFKELEQQRELEIKEYNRVRDEELKRRDHERKELERQRDEEIKRRDQERKDYERQREEEIKRRDQERKDYEREEAIRREREKAQDEAERVREKARLDAERAREEFERVRDKAREDAERDREKYERGKKQEDESHWRKMSIESMKVVATVLTTIGAIALWNAKKK